MSTWEQRMAARAAARRAAEREREFAEEERQRLEWESEMLKRNGLEFAAGPPGGCYECYRWEVWPKDDYFHGGARWHHITEAVVPGPTPDPSFRDHDEAHWCHHACHEGEPCYVIPPAMAAS